MLSVFKTATGARMWLLYVVICGGFSEDVNYIPVQFSRDGDRALWIALAICNYHVWCRLSLVLMLLFLTGHFIPTLIFSLSKFVWETFVILCDKLDISLSFSFSFFFHLSKITKYFSSSLLSHYCLYWWTCIVVIYGLNVSFCYLHDLHDLFFHETLNPFYFFPNSLLFFHKFCFFHLDFFCRLLYSFTIQ